MTAPQAAGAEGCYEPLGAVRVGDAGGEAFAPTRHAGSPWGPGLQHGGPVAGLLVRAMDRGLPRPQLRISRISVDILGAVPMDEVRVTARVERPGRRIELVSARMLARHDEQWREVAVARAWRLATADTADVVHHADTPLPPPAADSVGLADVPLPDVWRRGFVNALEWQLAGPAFVPGIPTVAWLRLARPLVTGETPTALEETVTIADVANGIGARLDARSWTFLNTDLTIHLHQEPTGPWVGLAAETSIGRDGIATSAAVIHGADGPIGRLAQTVLAERLR